MDFKNIFYSLHKKILLGFSLISLIIVFLLGSANPYNSVPNRDNGYYLFGGRFILNGGILYRNLWEERPPAMYYINALGLWIGRDTRWGVWFLELIFLSLAAWIGYRALKKICSPGAAVFGTVIWLWGLSPIMITGNLIEEYPILFSFIAFYFFILSIEKPDRRIYDFVIGICMALGFLFRANNIGVEIAIGLTCLIWGLISKNWQLLFKRIGMMALGAVTPILLVGLYFWYLGTLNEMIVASLLYGLYYTGEKSDLLFNLHEGFRYIGIPAWVALAGWLTILISLLVDIKNKKVTPLSILMVLIWPIEIILSGLSARAYRHYFVSWALSLAINSGYLCYRLSLLNGLVKIKDGLDRYAVYILSVFTVFVLIINYPIVSKYSHPFINLIAHNQLDPEKVDRVADYVRLHTHPGDKVLAWGGEGGINYMTHRDSPTAYLWYPTYVASPFTDKINQTFYDDLLREKPEIIVDAYIASQGDVPSINPEKRKRQKPYEIPMLYQSLQTPNINQVYDFINSNYSLETTIDFYDVYRLKKIKKN